MKKIQFTVTVEDETNIVSNLEKMWDEFGDIPINLDDEIEEDFYQWEKGTCRFEIWHWFDEKLPNGLVADFNICA